MLYQVLKISSLLVLLCSSSAYAQGPDPDDFKQHTLELFVHYDKPWVRKLSRSKSTLNKVIEYANAKLAPVAVKIKLKGYQYLRKSKFTRNWSRRPHQILPSYLKYISKKRTFKRGIVDAHVYFTGRKLNFPENLYSGGAGGVAPFGQICGAASAEPKAGSPVRAIDDPLLGQASGVINLVRINSAMMASIHAFSGLEGWTLSKKETSLRFTGTTLAHEVAHMLGAEHIENVAPKDELLLIELSKDFSNTWLMANRYSTFLPPKQIISSYSVDAINSFKEGLNAIGRNCLLFPGNSI